MPNTKETRDLAVTLTEGEVNEKAKQLAHATTDEKEIRADIEDMAATHRDAMKARKEELERQRGVVEHLAEVVEKGVERRAVECVWEIYPGGGSLPAAKYLIRIDTGEVVERALLSEADQQPALFDRDEISEEEAKAREEALGTAQAAEEVNQSAETPIYYYEERKIGDGDMGRIGLRYTSADKSIASLNAVLLNVPESDPGDGPVNRADWEWETEGVDFDDVKVELEAEAEEKIAGAVEDERLANPDVTYERARIIDPLTDAADAADVNCFLRFEGGSADEAPTMTGVYVCANGFGKLRPEAQNYETDISIIGRAEEAWAEVHAGA